MDEHLQKVIHVGIVGASNYAAEMLDLFHLRIGGLSVIGVFAMSSNEPGAQLAQQLGIEVYTDWKLFLACMEGRAQVVYNATPPHLHAETSCDVLRNGLQVWLEKPPVTSMADFDALCACSEQTGETVQVCFNNLYNPVLLSLKRALANGDFGQVYAIHTVGALPRKAVYFQRNSWAGRITKSGRLIRDGSLSNSLSHAIANAQYLGAAGHCLLDDITSWCGKLYRVVSPQAEDTVSLEAVGKSGIRYTFNLSLAVDSPIEPCNTIVTEAGRLHFCNYSRVECGADLLENSNLALMSKTLDEDVRLCMGRSLRDYFLGESSSVVRLEETRPFVSFLEAVYSKSEVYPVEPSSLGLGSYSAGSLIRERLIKAYQEFTTFELPIAWHTEIL